MNVSLTPELDDFVKTQLDGGTYRTASEVVREGLRLLQERKQDRDARLAGLRSKIAAGLEQLERGERIPGEEVFRELRDRNRRFCEEHK